MEAHQQPGEMPRTVSGRKTLTDSRQTLSFLVSGAAKCPGRRFEKDELTGLLSGKSDRLENCAHGVAETYGDYRLIR